MINEDGTTRIKESPQIANLPGAAAARSGEDSREGQSR
jgi:hypothetical protein